MTQLCTDKLFRLEQAPVIKAFVKKIVNTDFHSSLYARGILDQP